MKYTYKVYFGREAMDRIYLEGYLLQHAAAYKLTSNGFIVESDRETLDEVINSGWSVNVF